jgi:GNAT superfamily N-acetyltransferase
MNFKEIKTSSNNIDFKLLAAELDAHLVEFYGNQQDFFNKHNSIDAIKHVIVVYDNENPIGCGAIKQYSETIIEIKRMYVKPEHRGQGIAATMLIALENWAKDLGYLTLILETMKAKESVISMYKKNGYSIINNYGQYKNMETSVCMSKAIH